MVLMSPNGRKTESAKKVLYFLSLSLIFKLFLDGSACGFILLQRDKHGKRKMKHET